jgi:photosystem II stability/assembly factor-like uncharacterized protein
MTMQPSRSRACATAIAVLLAAGAAVAQAPAPSTSDPMALPSEVMPLASRALVLDIARAGTRIIAVGERGQILLSDDGDAWRQSTGVPLRSTLTAISAVGNEAWAVGHDGVILHSADAGESWTVQRRDPWAPAVEGGEHDLRQGVPLLDVLFTDASTGIAIGAYSLLLTTTDGGKTWNGSRIAVAGEAAAAATVAADEEIEIEGEGGDTFSAADLKIGQESDPHLNGIARTGSGALVIVGERGAIFRSRDAGASWERSQLPYDGSMFGVVGYDGDHVLAFGLRGHVFESDDLGAQWREVPTATELSLMGGTPLADGGAVVVGANGTVLHRASASAPFTRSTHTAAGVIAGVLPLTEAGELLVAGENGISRYQPK